MTVFTEITKPIVTYTEPAKSTTTFTEPAKTNVVYNEPQWISSTSGVTPKDIAGVTPKDIVGLTPKGFTEKYGKVIAYKINKPTFTEPEKKTVIYTEPSKG